MIAMAKARRQGNKQLRLRSEIRSESVNWMIKIMTERSEIRSNPWNIEPVNSIDRSVNGEFNGFHLLADWHDDLELGWVWAWGLGRLRYRSH